MTSKQKRWDQNEKQYIENKKVDAFFADLLRLINKHKLTISHEDNNGSFIVVPANKSKIQWLLNASVDLKDLKNIKNTVKNAPTDRNTTRIKYKFYKPDNENIP
jgi:hypothetical protein